MGGANADRCGGARDPPKPYWGRALATRRRALSSQRFCRARRNPGTRRRHDFVEREHGGVLGALTQPRASALGGDQYLLAIGSSSAGNRLMTRHPVSVTTTSSSMRAAE